ncbi:MAG: ABC-F family ATP-binding cassette domain-containing protein [Deltaproteobacteria bacterium]|nr:ABC-F family ATP-binding cassette domain-containing protein [Deltaproteobacteria bacterium]
MTALTADHVSRSLGSSQILKDVSLTVDLGERVGLIGANGSGKSTLARILAGIEAPDGGTVSQRRGLRTMLLSQEPELDPEMTVFQAAESGLAHWRDATLRFEAIAQLIEQDTSDRDALLHEQSELATLIETLGGWDPRHRIQSFLDRLGLTRPNDLVATLSGGERRRVALARLLVAAPDIAILDEPTNHLDADTVAWLEDWIMREFRGAMIIITHDRYLLDRAVTRIVELDLGGVRSYPGRYRDYLALRAERLAQEARVEARLVNTMRREQEWLSRGPAARTTKQQARIQRAQELSETIVSGRRDVVKVNLEGAVAKGGKRILEFRGVSLSLGGREMFHDLDLILTPGERIGVVGPNGAGKTSLLKLILGELEPTKGEVVVGLNTKVAYFDQTRGSVDLDLSVLDHFTGEGDRVRVGDKWIEPHAWLDRFGFDGARQRQKAAMLSGGERARLALALLLRGEANLILMDEPTNDLDLSTLAVLEEFLLDWPGTAIVVSHDRYFLDQVATSILSFEGDGEVVHDRGDWDAHREARDQRREARKAAARGPARNADMRRTTSPDIKVVKALTPPEVKELEALPTKIDAAESEVARLDALLASPGFYASSSRDMVSETMAASDAARRQVEALMARWEALELRRSSR